MYIFQAELRTLHQNPTTFNLSTFYRLYMRLRYISVLMDSWNARSNYVHYTDSKESYVFGRRLNFRRCWKVDTVFISGIGFSFKRNEDMTTNGEWRSCLFGFYHTNQLKLESRGPVFRPTTETYRLLRHYSILHTVILTDRRHLSRLVASDLWFNWLFEAG